MEPTVFILVAAAIFVLVVFLFVSYVKAREPRVLIGSGGFRIPFFERLDRVYLGQITVDIKTEESVPTTDFINVDVDAVAKIRVMPTNEGTRLAAKNFLNMMPNEIAEQLQDSLQGNMREIIGTLDLRSLNTDTKRVSSRTSVQTTPPKSRKMPASIAPLPNVTSRLKYRRLTRRLMMPV